MNIHDPASQQVPRRLLFQLGSPPVQKTESGCVRVFEAYCLANVPPTERRLIKPLPNIKQLLEIKTCGFIGKITKLLWFERWRLCGIGKGNKREILPLQSNETSPVWGGMFQTFYCWLSLCSLITCVLPPELTCVVNLDPSCKAPFLPPICSESLKMKRRTPRPSLPREGEK